MDTSHVGYILNPVMELLNSVAREDGWKGAAKLMSYLQASLARS